MHINDFLRKYFRETEDYPTNVAEQERNKETLAWLVERTGVAQPEWITLSKNPDYYYYNELWTLTAKDALKFADKQSAEDYITYKGLTKVASPVQHIFIGLHSKEQS